MHIRTLLFSLVAASLMAADRVGAAEGRVSPVVAPSLSKRPRPLEDLEVAATLEVADFGAQPDDGRNDLPAVRRAVERVRQSGMPARIVFGRGRYIFDIDVDEDLIARALKASVVLYKMEGVVLDGAGAEIVIRRPRLGFVTVLGCRNVIIRDFTVDWDPPPFAQGFIRGVHLQEGTFTFGPEGGYLSLDHPNWKLAPPQRIRPSRWGVIMDPKVPGRLKSDAINVVFYSGWEKGSGGTYRIAVKNRRALEDMEPGDRYIQVDRNGAGLVHITKSQRVTCINITSFTSPGLNYGGADCSEVAVLNCRVLLKPGRWHTSNADGLHFQRHRIGPWIEGCTFEGMSDDGANLYTPPAICLEVLSPRRFRVSQAAGWQPDDRLLAFNPREGRCVGRARVVSIERDRRAKTTVLVTDRDVVGIHAGAEKTADCFFNLGMNSSNFVIRNNTFRNIRRFGVLIQSRDGIVENNRFGWTSSNGVMVRNSVDWPEGFPSGNLVIRGNTFQGCGFDHTLQAADAAVIACAVKRLGGQLARWRALDRIAIEGNTIRGWRRRGILVACAENVRIADNRLLTDSPPPPGFRHRPPVPIQLVNVRNVDVTGNTIQDPRPNAASVVVQEEPCLEVRVWDNPVLP
ncbi:MAG TPA: right-handed parallel beta-helix repeat-containing protein [Planctomycetaceae bacterium]|nr:right-handed parallel beta-helix repeat-containing protein [Planctomycetaceae bacterium]